MAELAWKYDFPEETDLLERARGRDPYAIRFIIQRHNQRLYRIARSIVRDDFEAEDVLQEAYFRAFSNLDSFRAEARIGTWLSRIVVNEALGSLRRRRPAVELNTVTEDPGLASRIVPFPYISPQIDPETTVAQREIKALLERAIDNLPEVFRTILVARVVEGMSIEESAELFGISPETVKTRLHRARRLLKREMEESIGPVFDGVFPFAGRRCERLTENVLKRLGVG